MAVSKYKNQATLVCEYLRIPRLHLVLVALLTTGLVALSVLPSQDASAVRLTQTITIPVDIQQYAEHDIEQANDSETALSTHIQNTASTNEISIETPKRDIVLEVKSTPPMATVKTVEVKAGDNLSKIFVRAGLNDRDMFELIHSNKAAKKLAKLYPSHHFVFEISSDAKLLELTHHENRLVSHKFSRNGDGFTHARLEKQPDIKLSLRGATITSSLFMAGRDAMVEDRLIMELAGIFGWDIDFVLDIRENDSFKMLYEEKFLDGERIGTGNILAAEFINKKKTYTAVRYIDNQGNSQYFAPNGDTMRKEFLRTPIELARISSHFNLRRKHPVLNRIRAHKGTDYAAPRGTPVKSAGDGKVIFAGVKGGFGKTVIVQHGQVYKTLYAHLQGYRKGIRIGKRVKQGQTIGYVGSTGLATGPHLHYEFHVNGYVRNPVTVKLPKARSVAQSERPRFEQQTAPLIEQLSASMFEPNQQVALSDENIEP